MRNAHIAEWILGLVTSRDRAASTVGDLVEESGPRGRVRFWSGILRIAAALLWRDATENPVRITAVALIGLGIDVAASVLFAGLSGLLFFVVARNGQHVDWNSGWWTIVLDTPTLLMSLCIGRMLARLAPGRELSACLAYAMVGSLFSVLMMFVSPGGLAFSALLAVFVGDLALRTPVIAGTVWGRHRRLSAR